MLHTRLISNSIASMLYHVGVKGSVFSIVNARHFSGLEEGRMVSENRSLGLGKDGVVSDSWPSIYSWRRLWRGVGINWSILRSLQRSYCQSCLWWYWGANACTFYLYLSINRFMRPQFSFPSPTCYGHTCQKKDTEKPASERRVDHLVLGEDQPPATPLGVTQESPGKRAEHTGPLGQRHVMPFMTSKAALYFSWKYTSFSSKCIHLCYKLWPSYYELSQAISLTAWVFEWFTWSPTWPFYSNHTDNAWEIY